MNSFCLLFMLPLYVSPILAKAKDNSVRSAIERSLPRIQQGAVDYTKNRQCFSCHHQAMSILSLTTAKERGFDIDKTKIEQQVAFTLATFEPKKAEIAKGQGVPGASTMAAYALFALLAAQHKPDETTTALVDYLLHKQKPDGSWPAVTQRPPTEGSSFTNTALVLLTLKTYGPGGKEGSERRLRVDKAIAQGRSWLLKNQPSHTEDKVFHLRGLVYANAARDVLGKARAALLMEQREDGGWAQLPDVPGDAYATGTVLMALRVAGLPASDPAFHKGIAYLLKQQKSDGSWIVQTRSRPVQTFFDNGDPGGKSQFISFAATNWAVLALLEALPKK